MLRLCEKIREQSNIWSFLLWRICEEEVQMVPKGLVELKGYGEIGAEKKNLKDGKFLWWVWWFVWGSSRNDTDPWLGAEARTLDSKVGNFSWWVLLIRVNRRWGSSRKDTIRVNTALFSTSIVRFTCYISLLFILFLESSFFFFTDLVKYLIWFSRYISHRGKIVFKINVQFLTV